MEWNSSKTTISASQLLIKLFEQEDKRYKVNYENGIIKSLDRPLFPETDYHKRKAEEQAEETAEGEGSRVAESRKSQDMDGMGSRHSQRSIISNPASQMSAMQSQMGSVMTQNSKGFKRLQAAIDASNKINKKTFSESYINKMMLDVAHSYDIRSTIF